MGFHPISDRVISIRIHCKPINISVIQTYAPTSDATDEDLEAFYEEVQKAIDDVHHGDILQYT